MGEAPGWVSAAVTCRWSRAAYCETLQLGGRGSHGQVCAGESVCHFCPKPWQSHSMQGKLDLPRYCTVKDG